MYDFADLIPTLLPANFVSYELFVLVGENVKYGNKTSTEKYPTNGGIRTWILTD
jgi:hypothetical protein